MIIFYKPLGQTPLQAINQFQETNLEYKDQKLSYIGRLDPMAEGVMVVLVGEENKEREKYLDLDKEYEFEVLFGVATDTFDLLGKVTSCHPALDAGSMDSWFAARNDNIDKILKRVQDDNFVEQYIGEKEQPYPPYSSKTVNGKPLWEYAREGKLSEIEIPTKKIKIYDLGFMNERTIFPEQLKKYIFERINLVDGDFRQEEIKESWREFFTNCHPEQRKGYIEKDSIAKLQNDNSVERSFHIARFSISCSSGTYVRSLANEMGEKLGVGAIALSIKRTKIGEFSEKDIIHTHPTI